MSASGEWAYDSPTKTLVLVSPGTKPSGVVIARGTTVLKISPESPPTPPPAPRPPPRTCTYERTVRGRSPGSAVAALNATTLADCLKACCVASRCLAVHLDSLQCYLLDRRWEGNFVNDTHAGVCADRAGMPPPPPPPPPLPPPVTEIILEGLTFAGTDFAAVGYQEGFSETATSTYKIYTILVHASALVVVSFVASSCKPFKRW